MEPRKFLFLQEFHQFLGKPEYDLDFCWFIMMMDI